MILSHSFAFRASTACKPVERRNQIVLDRRSHGHVNGRGEHVVGALPHVHVIVGMDRLVGLEAVAAGDLDGAIADHLVGVHVARRARPGLKDVDRKLVVELPVGHFAASLHQGRDLLVVERVFARAGQLAQIVVGRGGGQLHQPQGMNQRRRQLPARHGKILDRPLRLGAVISLGRNAHLAHRIALDTKIGHRYPQCGNLSLRSRKAATKRVYDSV